MNTGNSRKNCKKMLSKLKRRGSIDMLAALVLVMVFGFLSFTADIGYIALTKGQMQTAADAAVLAAGQDLSEGWGDYASVGATDIATIARQSAVDVTAANRAGGLDSVYVDGSRDVRLGRRVWDSYSGSLPLFFVPIIGHETADLSVTASGMLAPAVGFRIVYGSSQTAGVLPITLDQDTWNDMIGEQWGPDNFSYNAATGVVSPAL